MTDPIHSDLLAFRVQELEEALQRLVAAVDEYPGEYPDREEEIAALAFARAALTPEEPKP